MNKSELFLEKCNQKYMVTQNGDGKEYTNPLKYGFSLFRNIENLDLIVIHCTAAGTKGWEDALTCIRYDLGANHICNSGCPTCTYHFYINQSGEIFQTVGIDIKTWHTNNYINPISVSICINHDGFKQSEITPELYQSLVETICYIADKMDKNYDEYGVRDWLHFHREYARKACPGQIDYDKLVTDVSEMLKNWGDNV
jgi:hypothetical protein